MNGQAQNFYDSDTASAFPSVLTHGSASLTREGLRTPRPSTAPAHTTAAFHRVVLRAELEAAGPRLAQNLSP